MGTFEGEVDSQGVSRRVSGRPARDHRRQDRRPGDRDARGRSAAEGRQPDGRAAQEPRHDQRHEEEARARRSSAEETGPGVGVGSDSRQPRVVVGVAAAGCVRAGVRSGRRDPARPNRQQAEARHRQGRVSGRLHSLPRRRRQGRGANIGRCSTRLCPDLTDCAFGIKEPDADWRATIHNGGPARGFSTSCRPSVTR